MTFTFLVSKAEKRRVGRPASRDAELDLPKDLSRKEQIVLAAAHLISKKGFDKTSIRDIGAAAGVLSGSLYYHFPSKEAIYVEVYTTGMKMLQEAAEKAFDSTEDPWDRLEAIAVAHSKVVLGNNDLMISVTASFPGRIEKFRSKLIAQRDAYEKLIARAVADLNLPGHVNPTLFRLQFLGAMNWAQTWYKEGQGVSAGDIGKHLVSTLRHSLERA